MSNTTPAPTDALLPCPFCGADNCIIYDDLVIFYCGCRSCGTTGSTSSYQNGAVAAWNRRAQPAASPAPVVAREPVAADDIKEPKNGRDWRVEWWNESCRMMLPACMKLDSFQSYKNGTLMFTLKRRTDGGITSKEGDTKC